MNTKDKVKIPDQFLAKFKFDPEKEFFIGCEREMFTTDSEGNIKPLALKALQYLDSPLHGYELSACQIEEHIGPVELDRFKCELEKSSFFTREILDSFGIGLSFQTIAPEDMPLDIFPDPTGRYQEITKGMPKHILSAACRVTGTHIHVGMPNFETALKVYNHLVYKSATFCMLGDLTMGRRQSIYKVMAEDYKPPYYRDLNEFYDYYKKMGYDQDPRKCWHFIRISVHGTIEFRMFDNTNDLDEICVWAKRCFEECVMALSS